jgi:hypothetical protein
VKREHENTDLRAQKMMNSRVDPSAVPTMVRAMPILVHAARQTIEIPQKTTPEETQLRKQR